MNDKLACYSIGGALRCGKVPLPPEDSWEDFTEEVT